MERKAVTNQADQFEDSGELDPLNLNVLYFISINKLKAVVLGSWLGQLIVIVKDS